MLQNSQNPEEFNVDLVVEIQFIPLNKLDLSPQNARKTYDEAEVTRLAASVHAHGLRQNLNVVPSKRGRFGVIAGGLRLRALQALAGEKKIKSTMKVPCRVLADDENLHEVSLAENVQRIAMHPADEFEAFVALAVEGMTEVQIAQRFGVTSKKWSSNA